MKACVLTPEGLQLQDVETPKATQGAVTVRLFAAGLNRRDFWITEGKYPGIQLPVVLGSDGCGIVEAADHALNGQRVVIDPSLSWNVATDTQGSDYSILGMPHQGTLAERIVVPAHNVFPVPPHCSVTEAATLPLAGVTAWRATVTRARVKAGQHVLVTGIGGGVATFAAQIAVAMGCRVWVTSSKPHNLERASELLGVEGGALYTETNWTQQILSQAGHINAVIDGAGGLGFNDCLGLLHPGGTISTYGATAGAVPNLNLHRIFWKQITVAGSTMGSPADFAAWLAFVHEHRLQPVVDSVFSLDECAKAFARLATSQQFGNVVVSIGS